MAERELVIDGRVVMVRETGDPVGPVVIYFHGTPGSRLDVAFGDGLSRETGVRLISFDRPGYGRSDAAPYTLRSVARDVTVVADRLGVGRFATLGWSGGGPFALGAAALTSERVTRVGVACGPAPFQEMPGGTEAFTESDRTALGFLPERPDRAAEQFRIGNDEMLQAMLSVRDDENAPWIDWMWGDTDPDVIADPAMRDALSMVVREGLRQDAMGICWDNVAWGGPWGFALDDVLPPVHLWYGGRDQMMPPANGRWLDENLPEATLTVYPDEGHLLPMRHWQQILRTLT